MGVADIFGSVTGAQWLQAGTSVLGSALKPAGAGPSSAGTSGWLDASGRSIVIGDGSSSSATGGQGVSSLMAAVVVGVVVAVLSGMILQRLK